MQARLFHNLSGFLKTDFWVYEVLSSAPECTMNTADDGVSPCQGVFVTDSLSREIHFNNPMIHMKDGLSDVTNYYKMRRIKTGIWDRYSSTVEIKTFVSTEFYSNSLRYLSISFPSSPLHLFYNFSF